MHGISAHRIYGSKTVAEPVALPQAMRTGRRAIAREAALPRHAVSEFFATKKVVEVVL